MNERIFELAKQAGLVPGGYANVTYADGKKIMTWREHFDNPGSLERFAELIVRECVIMADEFELDVNRSGLVDRMKKHFGVES
jgi:prepilin-type processing-associated H-X9-DG protein